jgi:hypothetical protein
LKLLCNDKGIKMKEKGKNLCENYWYDITSAFYSKKFEEVERETMDGGRMGFSFAKGLGVLSEGSDLFIAKTYGTGGCLGCSNVGVPLEELISGKNNRIIRMDGSDVYLLERGWPGPYKYLKKEMENVLKGIPQDNDCRTNLCEFMVSLRQNYGANNIIYVPQVNDINLDPNHYPEDLWTKWKNN